MEFSEDTIQRCIERYLNQQFKWVKKGLLIPDEELGDMTIDVFAVGDEESLLVECKLKSSPAIIGQAFGQALVERELLRMSRSKIEQREGIEIKEPIRICLVFCNFSWYDGWFVWGNEQENLLRSITRNLKEPVGLLLVQSRREAESYRELSLEDLYVVT